MRKITLGSGSAFWGDMLEPAVAMAERSDVQYIGFDHLAELTMAVLNRMKSKDPSRGYIPDLVPWMRALLPITQRRGIRVVTNAGGANPRAGAEALAQVARELDVGKLRIGVVWGDDVLDRLDAIEAQGWVFENLDTGEHGLNRIRDRLVAANAYTGSERIVEQLAADADVIVTGRVADNALYVGPLMHELGWDDSGAYTDRIGAAITVGHIIECAGAVTGGMSNMWRLSQRPWEIGFPIAEFYENGEAVITKTPGSGGIVNEWTVKEHLLYEVLDPHSYMMPDGIADFTTLELEDLGDDRVRVSKMSGRPRPETAKLCLGYTNGFVGEGLVFFPWPDAYDKARFAERWIRERIRLLEIPTEELRLDFVGVNMLHGEAAPEPTGELNEVGLRVAARTRERAHADAIRREVTHLWTMGPIGVCFGVPLKVRPVVSLWPTTLPWDLIETHSDQIVVHAGKEKT